MRILIERDNMTQQFTMFEPAIKAISKNGLSQPFALLTSSETNEWFTPAWVVELARAVMGGIDLDPASCDQAQQVVRAAKYYTKEENGLRWPWNGRTWLNPPYGTEQKPWIDKLVYDYHRAHVTEAILLTKSALGYDWFEATWDRSSSVCLARKRIPFINSSDGSCTEAAKAGSTFFYFGPNLARFEEVFSPIGRVYHDQRAGTG